MDSMAPLHLLLFFLTSLKTELSELSNTLPRRTSKSVSNLKKLSILVSGSQVSLAESKVYISTVSIPAYYTERKHLEKGTVKDVLRKLSGIPFAVLYGFALYVIMRYMVLSDSHEHLTFNATSVLDIDRNLCSPNYTDKRNDSDSLIWRGSDTNYFSGKHRNELVYGIVIVTIAVGITSVFSRNTRSTMLLILPGLITSRSRTFLFTFVLGLLCNGPVSSLRYNFDAILENAICLYKSAMKAMCKNNDQLKKVFDPFKHLVNEIQKTMEKISENSFIKIDLKIHINPNITWPEFKDLISAPPMSAIKAQVSQVMTQVANVLKYTHLTGKMLTVISIILMIIDAVRYIRTYYSDSSFDNMFITDSVRKLWQDKRYKILTPLRHWELNDGYKVSNSPKFTKREFYKSIRHSFPTLIFSITAIIIIFADILLTEALTYIKENEKLTISFDGFQQTYAEGLNLDLPSYNISANTCLSPPVYTPTNVYIVIYLVLQTAGISCILEVYMSRIRARMCNIFYPDKALERADYLHYRINIGRINRKFQLMLIVRRELERRAKLLRFSPLARLKRFLSRKNVNRMFVCPGCGWKEKCVRAREICFSLGESVINDKICKDCHLDLAGGEDVERLLFNTVT